MADQSLPAPARRFQPDRVIVATLVLLIAIAVFRTPDLAGILQDTISALGGTLIFIAFAVMAVAYLKASGAEGVVAAAFKGNPVRMVIMAALLGGLAPFCSCEVIPFIAALLAMGVPLAPVMAFWLSSPIMDPPMFLITTSALGFNFAVAKTLAAVGFGFLGGFSVLALHRSAMFADPLREGGVSSGCGCGANPFTGKPVWAFWHETERRSVFGATLRENAFFLTKWLTLAYVLEAMMIRYVPADWIAGVLGGNGVTPIALGAVLGGPAYLNGYAAAPLVAGLVDQGMSQGAAMSFMLAGSVSCIPAAVAVWAVVKPRVFAAYIGLGFVGALSAGLIWAAVV